MGAVPVAARNIFPSNIQGLPTWYGEVRISEAGHPRPSRRGSDLDGGRRTTQTFAHDIAEIEPGGYLLYDSSKPPPHEGLREDITVLGVPLAGPLQRGVYGSSSAPAVQEHHPVGALGALLGI